MKNLDKLMEKDSDKSRFRRFFVCAHSLMMILTFVNHDKIDSDKVVQVSVKPLKKIDESIIIRIKDPS